MFLFRELGIATRSDHSKNLTPHFYTLATHLTGNGMHVHDRPITAFPKEASTVFPRRLVIRKNKNRLQL